jgi:putative spermidine/putrescine transport system permease protein
MLSRLQIPILIGPAMLLIAVFLGALFNVLSLSFGEADEGSALGLYAEFLGDPYYRVYLWNSARIASYVTAVGLLLGFPIAYAICRAPRIVGVLLMLTLAIQFFSIYVVKMYGWMLFLGNNGAINKLFMTLGIVSAPMRLMYNEIGVAIGLFASALPLMVCPINASLQRIDREIEEAAETLGASRWDILREVTIPLSAPGMLGGVVLMFVFCFTAYLTPALLGGGYFKMIGNFIYEEALQNFNYPLSSAAAAVTLVFSLVVIFSLNALSNKLFGGWRS